MKLRISRTTTTTTMIAKDTQIDALTNAFEIYREDDIEDNLESPTCGAAGQTYSFLQESAVLQTRADRANVEVVRLIKKLVERQHYSALAQLASHISPTVIHYGTAEGDDVFAKVKGIIKDMIDRWLAEAVNEKAFCNEDTATETTKGELQDDITKLTAKSDQAAAQSTRLQDEVKELQVELAALVNLLGLIKKLAERQHSSALAQLASRFSTVIRYGTADRDDVSAMCKVFCNKETATEIKNGELQDDITKHTAKKR